MPLSPSGKLDRKALPEPDSQVTQGEYVAPGSDLEKQLAAIWQDVLDVEQVGLNDNFFELGGHSLLVINVMSRIQLELGAKISVHELFQHAVLKQLAEHLQGQGAGVSTEKLSFLDSLLDEMEQL
nr:phosphopantetheine-binding protein [Pseudomonas allii]